MKFLWILLTVLCMSSPALSAGTRVGTYYHISDSLGNDSYDGLHGTYKGGTKGPWATLGKIATQVTAGIVPGDRFLLRRGDTWTASASRVINLLNVDGKPYQNIIIGAYGPTSNANPIITGVGYGTLHRLIDMPGASYVTIRDITLIGGANTYTFIDGDAGTYDGGIHHVNILRLTLDNSSADQNGYGYGLWFHDGYTTAHPASNADQVEQLNNITVQSSTFKGMGGMIGDANIDKIDCISMNPPKGGYINIHHNTFIECADQAFDIPGEANHTIEYNYVLACGHHPSAGTATKFHSQYSHVSDSVIRGNLILAGEEYGLSIWNASGLEIYNNTIFYDETDGSEPVLYMGNLDTDPKMYGVFEDNIFKNNIWLGSIYLWGSTGASISADNTFTNNIHWNPATADNLVYINDDSDWITQAEYAADWIAKSGVTDDTNQNPDLVDANFTTADNYINGVDGDFSPAVGGDSIDGGVSVDMTVDIIGTAIPQGAAPDVGAYEYK